MDLFLPIEKLFQGKCFEVFEKMSTQKQTDTAIKVAFAAFAAGLIASLASIGLAPIIALTTAVYTFAYLTTEYSVGDLVEKCVDQAKAEYSRFTSKNPKS